MCPLINSLTDLIKMITKFLIFCKTTYTHYIEFLYEKISLITEFIRQTDAKLMHGGFWSC